MQVIPKSTSCFVFQSPTSLLKCSTQILHQYPKFTASKTKSCLLIAHPRHQCNVSQCNLNNLNVNLKSHLKTYFFLRHLYTRLHARCFICTILLNCHRVSGHHLFCQWRKMEAKERICLTFQS